MKTTEEEENEINLEMFRLKKLIQDLDQMRGLGTSLITLIINYKDQISQFTKMLVDEIGKASNIKSRVLVKMSPMHYTPQKKNLVYIIELPQMV